MKLTKYLLGLLAVAALSIGTAQAGSVLKIVPHADLKNTDPIWTTAYITRNHGYMIYDTLFAMDETFNVHPQMAGSHSVSDDGLVHTITLRDGLKWHDGSAVESADCIASIARWGKRDGMGQQLMAQVSSMDAVDSKTFTITLSQPWGLLTTALGKMSSNVPFMMPAEKAATDAFEQVPAPLIGSGPYKFIEAEWVPGNKAVYEKFADYVPRSEPASGASGGKVAHYDRVEWLYIPDQQTAMNALINGEVDFFEAPQSDLFDILEAADGVHTELDDNYGSQGWLRINHLNAPFDNVKARHAVQLLVDQELYLQAIVGTSDLYRTCGAMFLCDTPFETFVGSDRVMTQDIDKAKALLKEAGYNGEKIVLMHPTDIQTLSAATQVTASLLRKAGINLEVQAMDWSTLTSRRAEKKSIADGGWNIFHTSWIAPDLLNPVANIGVSGGGVEKAWFGWPTDATVEQLRQDFARETDPAKQKALADQVQARAMDVVTYVPIGQYLSKHAYREDRIAGILKGPVPFFWNVHPK
ncbi:MAG: ABC transporter substrate-binding protein [Arenicellales bacterium]|jgi:peptide/nickel transport system substrate-binding protein|nr:ABC transporter substrate-binding protein [Arenicellales bacterium]MDP7065308.1 ABC transporter substrate-binding protein [Arenicellales bacterium]